MHIPTSNGLQVTAKINIFVYTHTNARIMTIAF